MCWSLRRCSFSPQRIKHQCYQSNSYLKDAVLFQQWSRFISRPDYRQYCTNGFLRDTVLLQLQLYFLQQLDNRCWDINSYLEDIRSVLTTAQLRKWFLNGQKRQQQITNRQSPQALSKQLAELLISFNRGQCSKPMDNYSQLTFFSSKISTWRSKYSKNNDKQLTYLRHQQGEMQKSCRTYTSINAVTFEQHYSSIGLSFQLVQQPLKLILNSLQVEYKFKH